MTHRLCLRWVLVAMLAVSVPACLAAPKQARERLDNEFPGDAGSASDTLRSRPSPYGEVRVPGDSVTSGKYDAAPADAPLELPLIKPTARRQADEGTTVSGSQPESPGEIEAKGSASLIPKRPEGEHPGMLPLGLAADDAPIVQALRCYLDNRPDRALNYLGYYEEKNQQLLLTLLPLTARMAQCSLARATPQDVAVMVDQLQTLLMALRPLASLGMDKLCFCRQASKFGVYEGMETQPKFRAGELVELYFEIRNVSCSRVKSPQGEYQTNTSTALELREQGGAFILRKTNNKREAFQTAQHDYFDHYRLLVPANAPPGKYDLSVEVTDVPTGRKVRQKLEFQVRAN